MDICAVSLHIIFSYCGLGKEERIQLKFVKLRLLFECVQSGKILKYDFLKKSRITVIPIAETPALPTK